MRMFSHRHKKLENIDDRKLLFIIGFEKNYTLFCMRIKEANCNLIL